MQIAYKEKDQILKGHSPENFVRQAGAVPLFTLVDVVLYANTKTVEKYYGFFFHPILMFMMGEHMSVYWDKESFEKFPVMTWDRAKDGHLMDLPQVIDHEKARNDSITFYNESTPTQLEEMDEAELIAVVERSRDLLGRAWVTSLTVEGFAEHIFEEIAESVAQTTTAETLMKYSQLDTHVSCVTRAAYLLVEHESTDYDKQWIYTDYQPAPLVSEVSGLHERYLKDRGGAVGIKADYEKAKKQADKNEEALRGFLKQRSDTEQKCIECVQYHIRIRDERREYFQRMIAVKTNAARILLQRAGLGDAFLSHVLSNDFKSGLYKEKEYEQILRERASGMIISITKEGVAAALSSNVSEDERAFRATGTGAQIIKGSTAHGGTAQGPVSIIHSSEEFSKFNPGDVLVTSMTRPEFVPLMKQASAVVTDEGGITCHAAIISRELGIPCVTGTGNATAILTDGDLVEVDADAGIVRKLSQ